jgi:ABC-2 type transport system permease protein
VNARHFWTIVWLRWRLRRNQLKRGGVANVVILSIVAALGLLLAAGLFVAGLLVGMYGLRDASPPVLLLIWDGLVVGFLFVWLIGLMTELQRTEVFALDKFLHLPVTLTGVFVINYLSSLFRFSLIVFVPAMVGLSIGLVVSRGPVMLWLFPLMAAFFLMVTALTYQFQGWLAALMANPRRRRNILVVLTLMAVLLSQLPNIINMWMPRDKPGSSHDIALPAKFVELNRQLADKEITLNEYQDRFEELQRDQAAKAARENNAALQSAAQTAQLISAVVPPGWLPLGAMAAGEGRTGVSLLATLGLALIGSISLWRAYRTTLRLYTGQFTATPAAKKPVAPTIPKVVDDRPQLLERQLPVISEHAAAVALAGVRSLLRAPEAKMLLLTPVFMVIFFGAMLTRGGSEMSPTARAFLPYGAMAMTLLSFVQLTGNQFGFDRSGYRVFVLSPAPRREILLGKNLAIAPLALCVGWVMILMLAIFRPLRFDHLLAMLPQSIAMFLIFCLMANWLSIVSPMPTRAGSLKAVNPRWTTILLQLAFMLAFPIAMAPTLVPLAIEAVLPSGGWVSYVPVCLILSIAECALVIWLYRLLLTVQGDMLQAREKQILEVVTAKAE